MSSGAGGPEMGVLSGIGCGVFGVLPGLIPAIYIGLVLYASIPSAVCERLGPIEAWKRSADLTSGHRLTIFLTMLVLFLVLFMISCTINCGLQMVVASPDNFGQQQVMPLAARIFSYIVDISISLFTTIFQSAVCAVFYARVRGIRDGVDANAIAEVFA
jgi:hypothetical protein